MNDIVFCSECEYCGKTNLPKTHFCSEYQSIISIAGCERGKRKAKTNGDKVRAKSNEELAEFFTLLLWGEARDIPLTMDYDGWIEWLNAEVKE